MQYLDLDTIKRHLNLDLDFHADDEYLTGLGDTAEQIVALHLDNDLESIVALNDDTLPAPIRHAMLLLIGNLYMNRENIAFGNCSKIPFSYEYLLAPYKEYINSKI
jgi:uncharacterized phage protein (predicted DNA packaging)